MDALNVDVLGEEPVESMLEKGNVYVGRKVCMGDLLLGMDALVRTAAAVKGDRDAQACHGVLKRSLDRRDVVLPLPSVVMGALVRDG